MTSRLVALRLDAADPVRLAGFWAAMLDRDQVEDADGVLAPGDKTQVSLRFVPDRLVSLGAVRLEVGTDGAVVLADPDGNELLVLPR